MAVIATVTTRPRARLVATVLPARSICDNSQPPKMSPCGLASAGIAMARSAGSGVADVSVVLIGVLMRLQESEFPGESALCFVNEGAQTAREVGQSAQASH